MFKCSVIQQRYGSSSRSACSPDFKLTNNARYYQPRTWKLIGVKTMSLFGYGTPFVLSGVLPVFQGLNYKLSYREDYLMCCPTNRVIKSLYSDALAQAAVPYQTFHYIIV